MSGKIKVLIFDLGNVVININIDRFFKKILEHSVKKRIDITRDFLEIYASLEIGKYSEQQFFLEMKDKVGLKNITQSEFVDMFNDIFDSWNNNVLDFIKKMRNSKKYKIYALSNTNAIHIRYLFLNKIDLTEYFDDTFYSYDLGLAKPDLKVYRLVLEIIKSKPEECLFIDDNTINVKAAEKVGMKGLIFKNEKDFLSRIEKIIEFNEF
jgi:epoxide hydrolase-like predicted phosphatase